MNELKNDYVDFGDLEVAYAHLSNGQLMKSYRLFQLMNQTWLTNILSQLGMAAVNVNFPLSRFIVKKTIFEQFLGGETLRECKPVIDNLWANRTLTVLDYGAEAKSSEKELDLALHQFLEAVKYAAANEHIPVVSTKFSALVRNDILEKVQEKTTLTEEEQQLYNKAIHRLDTLCQTAYDLGVKVFIDAEESWIQDALDDIVFNCMAKYNHQRVVVYQTAQLYRKDRYDYILELYEKAKENGFLLGIKLVRGAYLEKENERASERGYETPIQPSKEATDRDFNKSVQFCVDHYKDVASCAATHNEKSCMLQAKLIGERQIPRNHPNLNFCQLYGMSNHITFNLGKEGFNVAKYVPYGKVSEVLPYLIRRAEENSAIAGEFSRELEQLSREIQRRKSARKQ